MEDCLITLFLFFFLSQNTDKSKGAEFMEMAANAGDRSAIIFMAEAYETGFNLPRYKYV